MIGRMIMTAALCLCVAACAPAASDKEAQQNAAQECAKQLKPDTAEYNTCVDQKTKDATPLAEQMRRVHSDEDIERQHAQDPQRDYMTR